MRTAYVSAICLALTVFVRADEAPRLSLHEIDRRRAELIGEIEAHRNGPNHRDLSHRMRMYVELHLLDYDDPRSRLSAALAMQNAPEQVVDVIFDMVLQRPSKKEELQRCLAHMAKHADEPKRAIEDVIWAICNSKEFVERLR